MYNSEAEMVADLRRDVAELWGAEASSHVEVRCHDQARMDILVKTPSALFAVEAKLSHWGRLLAQAFLHQYCVDYVYVAILVHQVTPERLSEAARYRIGVVSVDTEGTCIVQQAIRTPPVTQIRDRLVNSNMEEASMGASV